MMPDMHAEEAVAAAADAIRNLKLVLDGKGNPCYRMCIRFAAGILLDPWNNLKIDQLDAIDKQILAIL